MGFLRLLRPWGFSHEARRGPQGASRELLCLASFPTPRSSNSEAGDSKSVPGTTPLLRYTLEASLIFSLTSLEFFYNECALFLRQNKPLSHSFGDRSQARHSTFSVTSVPAGSAPHGQCPRSMADIDSHSHPRPGTSCHQNPS